MVTFSGYVDLSHFGDGFRIDNETGEVLEILDKNLVPDENKPAPELVRKAKRDLQYKEITYYDPDCPWPQYVESSAPVELLWDW